MSKYILSICIPVYNNRLLLEKCFNFVAKAIAGYEQEVQVVVSDNASQDDILAYVNKFKNNNPDISVLYSRNEINGGLAYNFQKVVELATGEYCWIIGSDDFIFRNSIEEIINVINENEDLAFLSVGHSSFNLNEVYDKYNIEDPYHNLMDSLENKEILVTRISDKNAGRIVPWDDLVDPIYNNVYFGAVMTGVFKRSLWMSVDLQSMDKYAIFRNVENTYPHCVVYSKCMIGKKAYYINKTMVAAGSGARDWTGDNFWAGFLPLINLKIFNEIIDYYKVGGLKRKQYIKCRNDACKRAGRYLYPYIARKKKIEGVSIRYIFSRSWYNPFFYYAFIKGFVKYIISKKQGDKQ